MYNSSRTIKSVRKSSYQKKDILLKIQRSQMRSSDDCLQRNISHDGSLCDELINTLSAITFISEFKWMESSDQVLSTYVYNKYTDSCSCHKRELCYLISFLSYIMCKNNSHETLAHNKSKRIFTSLCGRTIEFSGQKRFYPSSYASSRYFSFHRHYYSVVT